MVAVRGPPSTRRPLPPRNCRLRVDDAKGAYDNPGGGPQRGPGVEANALLEHEWVVGEALILAHVLDYQHLAGRDHVRVQRLVVGLPCGVGIEARIAGL